MRLPEASKGFGGFGLADWIETAYRDAIQCSSRPEGAFTG